jgi:hypothetical protein
VGGSYTTGSQNTNLVHALSSAVRDVLSNICQDRWIGRGGPTAWSSRFMPDLNPLKFYLWGHLNTLVYAAPVDERALHHRIVDTRQTTHN